MTELLSKIRPHTCRQAFLRSATALTLALGLGACTTFAPQPGPAPETGGRYLTLTTPVIAIGDTQEHLATGYPLHDNDSAVDAYIEVAQRPPEQPLFGRRLLEWVLQNHPGQPFLHLGDVLDLSCRAEGRRVAAVVNSTPNSVVILPGNHDGLLFGIYGYNVLDAALDPDARRWVRGCRRGADNDDLSPDAAREALSKRDFITGYVKLQSLSGAAKPGLEAPLPTGDQQVSWRNPDAQAYLSAVEARVLDGSAYAASYLAQRLKLPRAPGARRNVIIIGLDTNQSGALMNAWDTLLGRSPGNVGHVQMDQIMAIDKWVDEAIAQGDIVIFAGHHNWQSLGLPSRMRLRAEMRKLDQPLVYLSAHTHTGFWAVHRVLDRQPLLELNVSSLSDWPIAYRRISFAYDEEAQRLQVRGELMPKRDAPATSYAELLAAWEGETCARSGLPLEMIREFDIDVVRQQRDSRGSLIGWLLSAIPNCQTCEQPLYEHANAYQDAMLTTLLQGAAVAKTVGAQLPEMAALPPCAGEHFVACAARLLAEKPINFQEQVDLFRRKAALIAAANDYLDRLDQPQAKAYMTCRVVQAAKIDFDATEESRTEHRSEAKRRAENFFLIEASVGKD